MRDLQGLCALPMGTGQPAVVATESPWQCPHPPIGFIFEWRLPGGQVEGIWVDRQLLGLFSTRFWYWALVPFPGYNVWETSQDGVLPDVCMTHRELVLPRAPLRFVPHWHQVTSDKPQRPLSWATRSGSSTQPAEAAEPRRPRAPSYSASGLPLHAQPSRAASLPPPRPAPCA